MPISDVFGKISSYLFGKDLDRASSKNNPVLSVVYEKGVLRLNSRTINYSEKDRHTVFRKAFERANARKWKVNTALVLGLGAGGVLKELTDLYGEQIQITGVEVDEAVLQLARLHFNLDQHTNCRVICSEALSFVNECKDKFDLILMDAFIDKLVPVHLSSQEALAKMTSLLNPGGHFLMNYICYDDRTNSGFAKVKRILESLKGTVEVLDISVFGVGNKVISSCNHE